MNRDDVRDACRLDVARRGLTPAAVVHLTRDALGRIDLEHLAPVKGLLKRFFSDASWSADDDRALADLVGPGSGWWHHDLDGGIRLEFGWQDGAFRIELSPSLAETFDGSVVPEATPNPRTIRFVTGPIHEGPSRWYESAAGVDDPRVAQLFTDFDDVANVLVGPDFVAVGLRRPDRWETLLTPMLHAVTREFASGEPGVAPPTGAVDEATGDHAERVPVASERGHEGALERAWREIGQLRPDNPGDVKRVVAAAASADAAVRQVAARLLVSADADVAASTWELLLDDPSRSVRRAVVDAMVDAQRSTLRPLLERALRDGDAWTRWKSLRGLVDLGVDPSRDAVGLLAGDPDFRVRLEAAGALRERDPLPG
ncbi:MAG: Scaffold protein Nfu/NifU terminal [Actinomycetota bacterium]|nr:Scaffold protein Nfu/NifU terminal [Actinomycetota bacterium]